MLRSLVTAVAISVATTAAAPADAFAQRGARVRATAAKSSPRIRPTGSRGALDARQRRRIGYGDKKHPDLRRRAAPSKLGRAPLRRLRRLAGKHPGRDLASLRPGYERYQAVQARLAAVGARRSESVRVSTAAEVDGLSIPRVDFVAPGEPAGRRPRVLIVGGVHAGTERVGVEAATRFIERAAGDAALRRDFDITVLPLLTPSSLVLDGRQNGDGVDVNRSFQRGSWTSESKVVRDLVRREQFDLVLDIHGAGSKGRDGFFVLREGDDGGMVHRILGAMRSRELLDVPGAGGRPAPLGPYTFDAVGSATSQTAGTLKRFMGRKGRVPYSYTLEAPTRISSERQVDGILRLIDAALDNVHRHGELASEQRP